MFSGVQELRPGARSGDHELLFMSSFVINGKKCAPFAAAAVAHTYTRLYVNVCVIYNIVCVCVCVCIGYICFPYNYERHKGRKTYKNPGK